MSFSTFLDENHMGWSHAMAPMIMGNPERPSSAKNSPTASVEPTRRSLNASPAQPFSLTIVVIWKA